MNTHRFAHRRRILTATGASLFGWAFAPRASSAAGRRDEDRRLLVVVLRGGLDGLAAVPPIGDPNFFAARGQTASQEQELRDGVLPLQGIFALNARLPRLAALFQAGDAAILHAVASPSRERSHFAAQDVLESGLAAVSGIATSGWLNRCLETMPPGTRLRPAGFAVAPTIPLILRGAAPVDTWQPQTFRSADLDTIERLHALYGEADKPLASALLRGAEADRLLGTTGDRGGALPGRAALAETVNAMVRLMARPDGPRVAAMGMDGWDTHVEQGFGRGRMAGQLAALDSVLGSLRDGLDGVWPQTVVVVVTEFGRTVRINGSAGTDHGTGTIALLLGGAVQGRRVITDWPGLEPGHLFEGRDLAPTTDLRAVFKGVLTEHLDVSVRALNEVVFPGSAAIRPLAGLVRNV